MDLSTSIGAVCLVVRLWQSGIRLVGDSVDGPAALVSPAADGNTSQAEDRGAVGR